MKNYLNNNPDIKEDLIIKLFTTYKEFKDKFRKAQGEINENRKIAREFIALK